MTRIRKGHNLLSKGHLQPNFVMAPGPLNQDTPASSRVVDNKAIFNSILNRISSMSSDGAAVETSEDKRGVVPETLCDDDTQGESAATTAGVCSAAGQRLDRSKSAQQGSGLGSGVQQELIHVPCATKKPTYLVAAIPRAPQGGLVITKSGGGAFGGPVANESASSRSHSASMDLISPGCESKASDTRPGKLSGSKRDSMEDSRDPGAIVYEGRNMPSSGLEVGDDSAGVPDFKQRNLGQAEDNSVHQLKQVDRNIHVSPWSEEEGTLRWFSASGLSPHLKRPRTQTRRFGGTAGRMARKRPRPPDSSAPENEDTLLKRRNESKGPCPQSPSEQMTGLEPSDTAGTGVSQRTEAESSGCRTKNEVEPIAEMSSEQRMEETHAVQQSDVDVDDPSNQLPGSLMHSLHLVFLEAGSRGLSVREAMTSIAKKGLFPAAVAREKEVSIVQVRGELASSPYFIEVEEGRFYLCSSLQDMQEASPPEALGPKTAKDEPCVIQMGTSSEQRTEAERTEFPSREAGCGQALEEATLVSSRELADYNLQGYLHQRAESSMRGRALRDSLSSERSYDSDKADRESDEDFDVKEHFSGYSSESTTVSDSQLSGEEDMTSHQQARSTRTRGASAGDTGTVKTVKKAGWRYLVDSVSEEDKDSNLGRQCARTDGRRWQCPLRAGPGYALCEHHLEKFRRKKAYAVLQRRAMAETRASHKSRQPTPEPRSFSARPETAEPDGQEKEQIAFSTHLNSKGQRKTVKNRSLMSMY